MIKTAPRISDKSGEYLPTQFSSVNAGLEYLADSWPTLHRRALGEIRGRFTAPELSLIVDVFNATSLTPALAGQQLAISVADGIALDGLGAKWAIDGPALNAKIAELTSSQASALEIWANGFWYANAGHVADGLDKYLVLMI
jgi:hypothetical protein